MFVDVEIEVEPSDVESDLFEPSLLEFADDLAISVTYSWGVSVFFALKAKSLEDALTTAIKIVRKTGVRVIGAELSVSDESSYASTCNAYRSTSIG